MVERVRIRIKRVLPVAPAGVRVPGKNGGRRAGSGKKLGSVEEFKRVARARAALVDKLPHELLLEWSRTGVMRNPRGGTTQLTASERIACVRGCANFYAHPKAAAPPKDAPAPVLRVELDERALAALAKSAPDKLEIFRDVLRAIQAGGGDLTSVTAQVAQTGQNAVDGSRYAQLLADGDVEGNA